jgi:hypothetical protein
MDHASDLPGPGPRYMLLDADRRPYPSPTKGALGGHRRSRIYGRLDCPAALRAIARGRYVAHRIFFADTAAAEQAGYRPCAVCLPGAYRGWKRGRDNRPATAPTASPLSRRVKALIRHAITRGATAISMGGGR